MKKRRPQLKVGLRLGLGLAFVMSACAPAGGPQGREVYLGEVGEVEETSPMALTFEDAAEAYGVPVDVLKALAYIETRFEGARGEVEFEGQAAPWGLFNLRGEELEYAAQLSGLSVEQIHEDDGASVVAVAALLSAYADEVGLDAEVRADPANWGPVVAKFGNLIEDMQAGFARDVMEIINDGVAVPMADGTNMLVRRHDVALGDPEGEFDTTARGLGQAGALQRPSPNNSSRGGQKVEMVIIHTCEGGYSGCVSWLRQTRSRVSAHYVVKENGREVSQLVDENRKAWHIGTSYRSRLNSGRLSHLNGRSSNNFTVGIEHGGSARQRSFPAGQIDRSVELVRGITSRHRIPRDRYHIVAHGQLQPESRTDPGPNWPWASYLRRIASGSSNPPPSNPPPSNPPPSNPPPSNPPPSNPPPSNPPPSSSPSIITVDNTTSGRFRASGSWDRSRWASGKVGSDYRFRKGAFKSDPASYKVNIREAGRYEVQVRVPGNGYNTKVPYIIHHRGGKTVVHKDISRKGAQWLSLGTYNFARKDDWIFQISVWTNGTGYIIADAVRFVRR